MEKKTIDGKLLFAKNLLTNAATTPAIADNLALFGYDASRLAGGTTLLTTAQNRVQQHAKEYGEQFAATDALYAAQTLAHKTYIIHIKIGRVALKGDRGAEESMKLSGSRKESFSGWLEQTKAFYANALNTPSVLTRMAGFGITDTQLLEAQTLVLNTEMAFNSQLKEKGEAQQATLDRDNALDALDTYISDLVVIARIALEEHPQHLEMLGLVV